MEEPNYYAIIPGNVRYDKELSPLAKLLYGEITALSNKEGYCYASNNYFATLYGCSKVTIQRQISLLVDKGYIKSTLTYYKGSLRVKERRLYLVSKMILPGIKFDMRGGIKNDKENNTRINNKKNNSNFKKRDYSEDDLNKFYL